MAEEGQKKKQIEDGLKKTECNRDIMKERNNNMDADEGGWGGGNGDMTGRQKNKKRDFPHQYSLLSHRWVRWGS